jgi:hypothetical protein
MSDSLESSKKVKKPATAPLAPDAGVHAHADVLEVLLLVLDLAGGLVALGARGAEGQEGGVVFLAEVDVCEGVGHWDGEVFGWVFTPTLDTPIRSEVVAVEERGLPC